MPSDPSAGINVTWPSRYHWGTVRLENYLWIGGVIEFTLDGQSHRLEVLPVAYTCTASGITSIPGGTRPGVMPVKSIGLSFHLTDEGGHTMINTGNAAVDDGIGVTLDDKNWRTLYYECVGDRSEIRYVDLGTVTIESASRERLFLRGTFSGTLAVVTDQKVRCGPGDVEVWAVRPIYGTFRCGWRIL
jgi:hypothetical protein